MIIVKDIGNHTLSKSYSGFSEVVEGVAELPGLDQLGWIGWMPQSSRVWVM